MVSNKRISSLLELFNHLRVLNFLLAFPLFQNIPLTSHDPRGHAVVWTLCCFPVIFVFLVDMLSCGLFFCYFNIPRRHAVFWTLRCFSFIFIYSWTCRVDFCCFFVIWIFLVGTPSCGHFFVFLLFSYFSWTCCHVDNFIIFWYFNISRGHFVTWTFFTFCQSNIPRGHILMWTPRCFLLL